MTRTTPTWHRFSVSDRVCTASISALAGGHKDFFEGGLPKDLLSLLAAPRRKLSDLGVEVRTPSRFVMRCGDEKNEPQLGRDCRCPGQCSLTTRPAGRSESHRAHFGTGYPPVGDSEPSLPRSCQSSHVWGAKDAACLVCLTLPSGGAKRQTGGV